MLVIAFWDEMTKYDMIYYTISLISGIFARNKDSKHLKVKNFINHDHISTKTSFCIVNRIFAHQNLSSEWFLVYCQTSVLNQMSKVRKLNVTNSELATN